MKFSQLSRGASFTLVPDDGKVYIKLYQTQDMAYNAKFKNEFYSFGPNQEIDILNNIKRDKDL